VRQHTRWASREFPQAETAKLSVGLTPPDDELMRVFSRITSPSHSKPCVNLA
jgi:hypothetical protein